MTTPLTVRPAMAADRAALGRLGALLVAEHHQFDSRRFIAPIPDLPQRYGTFLIAQSERTEMTVLVAERKGEVVGYAFAGMEGNDYMALRGPAGVVYDLVVDPDHRRQGIGRTLLAAALDAVAGLGAPRAVLFTADKNHVAQALFDKAGFRRTMVEMTLELGAGSRSH
jgi:ribosomal protein S18 acetylase RimI-like enzyme